jgi:hypothetical protein
MWRNGSPRRALYEYLRIMIGGFEYASRMQGAQQIVKGFVDLKNDFHYMF